MTVARARAWRLMRSLPKGTLGLIIFVAAACAIGVAILESRREEDSGYADTVSIYDTDRGLYYTLDLGYVPLSYPEPPRFGTVQFDVRNDEDRLFGHLIRQSREIRVNCSVCGPAANPRSDPHVLRATDAFDSVRSREIRELLARASVRVYWTGLAGAAVSLGFSVIAVTGLTFLAMRWIDDAKDAKTRRLVKNRQCPMCGYDLRGAMEKGCSECGWGRPPDDGVMA